MYFMIHILKKMKAIITSSETLTNEMRRTLEKVYDCKVFDSYSGVEARISFDESAVKIQVTLGLMMSAFKGVIEKEINLHLNKKIS